MTAALHLASLLLANPLGGPSVALEPPIESLTRAVHLPSGEELALDALVEKLAEADVVFLGETHLDDTTHRVELELFRRLLLAREGRVVLAMEMFTRDAQPALDAYVAREIDEATFLERVQTWPNYASAYRPLVELARQARTPVIGSNVPPSIRRAVAMGGEEAWSSLDGDQASLAPAELLPSTDAYWKRVDNAVRGHRDMMPAQGDRRFSTQSLWDNSMGEACALALDRHPGSLVLHVNGGFHSRWWDGTVHQLAERKKDARIATVAIQPALNPTAVDVGRIPAATDYVVLAAARTADADEGLHSAVIGRELRYRLHVPKGSGRQALYPLLFWLPDDGASSADELAAWKQRLGGDSTIIAVIEPLHRERQEDLSMGGRWFWPEDFREDVLDTVQGLDLAWSYVMRHHPVDVTHALIAGEGVGATIAVAAMLYGDKWHGEALAVHPAKHAELRDLPLPLPEDQVEPRPKRRVAVMTPFAGHEWWSRETAEHREVGLASHAEQWPDDPWARESTLERQVRTSLGLPPPQRDRGHRAHVILEHDTPLARNWARRMALSHSRASREAVAILTAEEAEQAGEALARSRPLSASIDAERFADGKRLPLAPGPFGGTTLVVLGDDVSEEQASAWKALEEKEVLSAVSRFHRLRVARLTGEPSVSARLSELAEQGRRNVLIVPAAFAAGAEHMRALRDAAREHEADMTLHYRPGLGSAFVEAPETD